MKKLNFLMRNSLFVLIFSMLSTASFSQFDKVGDIIKAGKSDANTMLESYLTPLGKSWGYDLAGGWYNTASTHSTLGFDLTFSTSFAKTPDEDLLFDITELGLQKIQASGSDNDFPTITNGENINSITITEEVGGQEVTLLPDTEIKGFDVPVGVPMPALNLGIGIIKNTELVGRFVPSTSLGDFGEIGLWGIGVKHDFLQWLPIVDKIPVIKGSIFLGYTNMSGSFGVDYNIEESVDELNGYVNPDNQEIQMNTTSFHTAIIVGAALPVVHPYVSFGLSSGNFNLDLAGEYALPAPITDNNGLPTGGTEIRPGDQDYEDNYLLNDPLSVDIATGMKPSVAAGLRIKLTVLTIHAQYTIQEYPMITGGIGVSFR